MIVLGAGTVVAADGKILGKPKEREDAIRMVKLLQGRSHQVYTGVTLGGSVEKILHRTPALSLLFLKRQRFVYFP